MKLTKLTARLHAAASLVFPVTFAPIAAEAQNTQPLLLGTSFTIDTASPKFGEGALVPSAGSGGLSMTLPPCMSQSFAAWGFAEEGWVKIPTALPSTVQFIFGNPTLYVAETTAGLLEVVANGTFLLTGGGTTPPQTPNVVGLAFTQSSPTHDGSWHHVELDAGPTNLGAFVDGVPMTSMSAAASPDPQPFVPLTGYSITSNLAIRFLPAAFYVGGYPDARMGTADARTFAGEIDELALWSGVRHYANFTPPASPYIGNETGLVALFHFDSSTLTNSGPTLNGYVSQDTSNAALASSCAPTLD